MGKTLMLRYLLRERKDAFSKTGARFPLSRFNVLKGRAWERERDMERLIFRNRIFPIYLFAHKNFFLSHVLFNINSTRRLEISRAIPTSVINKKRKKVCRRSIGIFLTHFVWRLGCGGGQLVSVFNFNSYDRSLNPAEGYNFSVKIVVEKTKKGKLRELIQSNNDSLY